MSSYADRLKALREQLQRDKLDGFVVPLTDEHMSEYVGSYAQRLAWLTGFEGSAGSAVVLPEEAAIFVDGRYTLQVRQQVSADQWSYQSVPETSTTQWLEEHAPQGARIGYDPWLHTRDWVKKAKEALASRGAELVAVDTQPDRRDLEGPARSVEGAPRRPGRAAYRQVGRRKAHRDRRLARPASCRCRGAVGARFDRLGVQHPRRRTWPHAGRAGLCAWSTPTAPPICSSPARRSAPEVRQHLGNGVRLHERAEFESALAELKGKTVVVDPERAVAAIFDALEKAGAKVLALRDPTILPKAIKNPAEIAGQKSAQTRDGAVIAKFLHWIDEEAPKGGVDELKASDHLEALRRDNEELRDLSFDSISGAGPNGAIVHYRSSEKTNRKLEQGTLYLIDSGGQYVDGTTDITRTVPIGEPTAEMKDRFTRVLQGHIAIATAVFPKGTRGSQLDSFARRPLWEAGLDYAHGTGHGVGSFLSVHEGPQRISPVGSSQERRRRAAAGGHDPLQRARLLQDRRLRHPDREFGAGRRARDRRRGEGDARLRDADLRADRPPADRRRDADAPRSWSGSTAITRMSWPGSGRRCPARISTGCSGPARRSSIDNSVPACDRAVTAIIARLTHCGKGNHGDES